MVWENKTILVEFFPKGLSGYPRLELLFFVVVLIMYVVILLGNGTLILISILDSHLHTPMYFFLVKQMSRKERFPRKKYIGLCRRESRMVTRMRTSLPSRITRYKSRMSTKSFLQLWVG